MIIEYIERGQVMVCNEQTMEFTSPITRTAIQSGVTPRQGADREEGETLSL